MIRMLCLVVGCTCVGLTATNAWLYERYVDSPLATPLMLCVEAAAALCFFVAFHLLRPLRG